MTGQRAPKGGASSFATEERAERAVVDALREHEEQVAEWLGDEGRPGPTSVRSDLDYPTGRHVPLGGSEVSEVTGLRVVLRKDPSMPSGYRVTTAYPVPAQGEIGRGVERDLPALAQLCGAGLHQDFWETEGSPEAVVAALTADPTFATGLPADVDRVLELVGDDDLALGSVLDGLGNNYDYAEDGLGAREWLTQVVAQVQGADG